MQEQQYQNKNINSEVNQLVTYDKWRVVSDGPSGVYLERGGGLSKASISFGSFFAILGLFLFFPLTIWVFSFWLIQFVKSKKETKFIKRS